MKNLTPNMVKLFLIHAKENNISEVSLNELRNSFFEFKNSEKYGIILQDYQYDEDNICLKYESEILHIIKDKELNSNQNLEDPHYYLYIYDIDTSYRDNFSPELNNLCDQMVLDYRKLNMKKQKVKI